MLQAYIDDSSSDGGRFFLAGYVDTATRWQAFSHAWAHALHQKPAINYLHMVDAQALCGEFQGWSEKAMQRKVAALANVVAMRRPRSIEVSVDGAHYSRSLGAVGPYILKHPYHVCFYALIIQLAKWHFHMKEELPVDIIFDEQGSIGLDALLWYDDIKRRHIDLDLQRMLGGPPMFGDDRKMLPLQAADMLVWHLRRQSEPRFATENRPTLDVIRGSPHAMIPIPNDALNRWEENIQKVRGIEVVRTKASWQRMRPTLTRRLASGLGPPSRWQSLRGYYAYRARKFLSAVPGFERLCRLFKSSRLAHIIRRRRRLSRRRP